MSKTKKIVALTSVIVAILIGTVGIYSLTKEHTPQFSLKDNKTIKLEYGEKYSTDEMDLLDTKKMKDEDKKILKKGLKVRTNFKYEDGKDYPAIGDYEITMLFNEKKLVKKVKVVDTTPPEVSTDFTSIDIVKGTDLTKYDFNSLNLFKISDLSPTELEYDYSAIDANTEGTYVLKANVKDSSGNLTTKELSVNITKAPEQNL